MLQGEPTHGHFYSGAIITVGDGGSGVGQRLWLFGGRQSNGGSAHKHVESYDFATASWKLEGAPYPNTHGTERMGVAELPSSKVSGRCRAPQRSTIFLDVAVKLGPIFILVS